MVLDRVLFRGLRLSSYSNASTQLNINGFLMDRIPLTSGVRQGCPLSALLYVLVIELLALQLRSNPNIVGFTIQGKRLVSTHYADDAVIKITQNRCFNEVYKDLQLYQMGTGAKVNYGKTKGLWLGKWRCRQDDPFRSFYPDGVKPIVWSADNVKYLGIYVGNNNPALKTFQDIVSGVRRRLNFWKPLCLPILAKARVIEIFHASKLWYAASFYPIPDYLEKELADAFMDYIIFPKRMNEVSRMEMEKERAFGGIKLINIKLKSETPKIHWLMRLLSDDGLGLQLRIFNSLVGIQAGGLRGQDVVFSERSDVQGFLKLDSLFYKEAIFGITRMNTWKHIPDINDEHIFYNRVFSTSATGDDVQDN